VQKGEIRKGEEILEVILQETPEDPSVNNDLGYLYADQGKNLEQAKEMIGKAVKSEPENGAYLDSMGWVLHKLGNQEEAIKYLLRSSEKSTTSGDATIWDHVGDVYQAMNRGDEAKKYWTKALELAKSAPKPSGELISKIEAKLK
jgi:Tfp pilus assembly protein PilF